MTQRVVRSAPCRNIGYQEQCHPASTHTIVEPRIKFAVWDANSNAIHLPPPLTLSLVSDFPKAHCSQSAPNSSGRRGSKGTMSATPHHQLAVSNTPTYPNQIPLTCKNLEVKHRPHQSNRNRIVSRPPLPKEGESSRTRCVLHSSALTHNLRNDSPRGSTPSPPPERTSSGRPAFLMPIAGAFAPDPLGQTRSAQPPRGGKVRCGGLKITPNFSFACLIDGPRDMDLCVSKETQRWWGRCLREREEEEGVREGGRFYMCGFCRR